MIQSILALFALGTLWFWVLLAVLSIIFIASIENEKYAVPTLITLVFTAVYWKAFSALSLDWRAVAIGVGVYAFVGILWSIFRWFKFVKSAANEYRSKKAGSENSLTEGQLADLRREISVSNNKSRITAWIAYWPWSLVWNITGDFFTMIYENLEGLYQKIADRAVGKFEIIKETKNERK